ncbi:MAG: HEPN domain-containing protein [Proteobacteria bacterium]|nr:HEPN domain-containing protein [Pseudomonadota bacterium]
MTVFYMASNTTVKMDESAGIQAGLGPAPVGLGALAQAARSKVITEYEELSASEKESLKSSLTEMSKICGKLGLETSAELLVERLDDLPQTEREFQILVDAMMGELRSTLFLFVPPHRTQFFGDRLKLGEGLKTKFPVASKEIAASGDCLAVGSYTATVFHAMRAAEIGLRALARTLKVSFPSSLDLENWKNIIDQIESKIKGMEQLTKSKKKVADLKFYSEAAAQFRYFREAWRNHVMHTRENYQEGQALDVFNHVHGFFLTLSTRLEEPKRSP